MVDYSVVLYSMVVYIMAQYSIVENSTITKKFQELLPAMMPFGRKKDILGSRAISRVDIGFYLAIELRLLLESLYGIHVLWPYHKC